MGSLTNKNVLVTGGAGFIGSNLVRRLIEIGAFVTVIDDLFTGKKENLRGLNGNISFHETTINDADLINAVVPKMDIIFHLAARNIIASTKSPMQDFQTNIGGTLNLLMAMQKHPCERFVYASSASVYGNPKYLPINEDDHINLLTPYAVSKYSGEGYCMAFYESYELPVTILRYSNVYGPFQLPDNPYCGVVARFMDRVAHNQQIVIHGDGLQTRDFTYVKDVVEATVLAATESSAIGEVFNVATGIETNINELSSAIKSAMQPPITDPTMLYNRSLQKEIPDMHIDRRDIDNIRRRVLNIEKIRRKLRWIPEHNLRQGLKETAQWFNQ